MNEPHEGKRKCEALWPVHQINWQRSRYVFDMYYRYKKISREVYDYCVQMVRGSIGGGMGGWVVVSGVGSEGWRARGQTIACAHEDLV